MSDGYPVKGNDLVVRTFGSDDVGGVHVPRVKLTHGVDGVVSDASDLAPLPVRLSSGVTGGMSAYRNIDLRATGVLLKGSAGLLYSVVVQNLHASADRFVRFYDKATAPTVGTDTPKLTYRLKSGESLLLSFLAGVTFDLGIGMGATTALVDADTGAPGAGEVIANVLYK